MTFLCCHNFDCSNHKGKPVDLPAPGGADKITLADVSNAAKNESFIDSIGKEEIGHPIRM